MSKDFYFTSTNNTSTIHAKIWQPQGQAQGVIMIVHGMAEHIGRYEEFAQFLTQQHYIVVGNDHLGHGDTDHGAHLGYFGRQHPMATLLADERKLLKIVSQHFPSLPYIILGHSMGTMMVQSLLPQIDHQIAAAILIGSSAKHPELTPAWPLISLLNRYRPHKTGKLLDSMAFGSFSKPFNKHVKFSWLTHDADILAQYTQDPLSGFTFTNNGFYTLFSLTKAATKPTWINHIRHDLPILIASGTHDPVGKFSQGPKYHFDLLTNAHFDHVTLKLFEGLRHEILNERTRSMVYQFIADWLTQNVVK